MIVTIIGTGNVATVLSKLILSKGHNILQVYGRTNESAKTLADHVHAEAIINVEKLNLNADIYIICIADKAIEIITKKLHVHNKLLLHTAGSVKKDILQNSSSNFGVLYPIQSIRKDMNLETKIPLLIDTNNVESLNQLEKFAKSISNDVTSGNDVQRLNLHIAAVFANNFVNYMYVQSAIICEENNLDFKLLQPLIEETAMRIRANHPKDVFTGPAIRKDTTTIQKHKQALAQHPKLLELYNSITKKIMEY